MKYDTTKFNGLSIAFPACYDENGDISAKAITKACNFYYEKGIRSLYVNGSSGEGMLLNTDERMLVIETVMNALRGKMVIINHVAAPSTRESIKLAIHSEKCGVDAIAAVPSVFYRQNEASIEKYWNDISNSCDLPFFIYNIPALTGYNLSNTLFAKMVQNEKVCGIKSSSEVAHDIIRFKMNVPNDFIVFSGCDEHYLAGRVVGANGGIGGTYAVMYEIFMKIEQYFLDGEITKATALQKKATALIYRLISFPSMMGSIKAILKLDGLDIGSPRLPFFPVDCTDPELIALHDDIKNALN